ncbi:MAG: hypothetical protein LC775_14245, partial [Acidobacteria bacterium]|nr:hypothetical protein [Acidobacteriota bacterium]
MTFLDQAVSSGSNFATGLVIARLSGVAEFGDYALTFMVWLMIVGLHRALLTEPLIVNAGRTEAAAELRVRGFSAELLLGALFSLIIGIIGLIVAAFGSQVGILIATMALWLVPLLVQDYWRAIAFQQRRPGLALANDLTFVVTQVAVITFAITLGWRSPGIIITAWGIGATAGALLGWISFHDTIGLRSGWLLLGELWPHSKWMLADFLTGFASDQAYIAAAALLLSRAEYGGFRAALSLMGPAYVILIAGGNMGLPEASRRAAALDPSILHGFARRLSVAISLAVALYGLVVVIAGKTVLRHVYGEEFAPFSSILPL